MSEARIASALDHPNICTVHEIDETEDGQLFIAMPYYEGETLNRIERSEAVAILTSIFEGMERAHARGIVHRDIKPGNIILTVEGVVKIIAFGVARLMSQATRTQSGTFE